MSNFYERLSALAPPKISIPHTIVKEATGSFITDIKGKRYLDFITGIGVMSIGHNHPAVVDAVAKQLAKFNHTCFGIIGYEPYVELLEKLVELFPHHLKKKSIKSKKTKGFLTNSGTDSIENAIKIARSYTKRTNIIAFTNGFHGRNHMAMHLTDRPKYRKYCGPASGEIFHLRFPHFFKHGAKLGFTNKDEYLRYEIEELEYFFSESANPEEIAAVVIELVQGEGGGFTVMPKPYLKKIDSLCKQYGILLIIDEVQSGFARTGKWAAYQHYEDIDFTPDITTWAKALGGGYPLGAVLAKAHIIDNIPEGILGGTYWGNPICCASANATISVMKEIDLPALALERGKIIKNCFNKLCKNYEVIGEVRGLGAMLAIELVLKKNPKHPAKDLTQKIISACRANGLLLIAAGHDANVIRILCPLNIEIENLKIGLTILENCFKKLA